ncbi:MAG: ABC transporter ATP-binding protein, partial [Eubacteriales bacterium]|nr:ABC transporter ATP-binding protein [Eubacteriales bacterium]
GGVFALTNYMSQILVELVKLANTIIMINKGVASAARIEAVLEEPTGMPVDPALPAPENAAGSAVAFDHVGLTYSEGADPSLTDITFTAAPGETVGIIGSTGSGKTSVVNLIARFYDATAGTVAVDGADVRSCDPDALRQKIGIVPQKAVLFRGTVRSNLLWGRGDATDDELWQVLDQAQAKEFVAEKKGGLDAPVAQNGKNFSGGQRQRLTVARALVRRPSILILDDSSSALDYATDAALRGAIRQLDYHPTVFLISQRTASIRHADRILVLDDGQQVGLGTHEELLNTCPVYREIYDSQYKKEGADA